MRKIACDEFTYIEKKGPLHIVICTATEGIYITLVHSHLEEPISEEYIKQQFMQDDREIDKVIFNEPLYDFLYRLYSIRETNRLVEEWWERYNEKNAPNADE